MRTERADRDALTGLLSRKVFEERFQEAAAQCAVEEKVLSLAFLDIDHFKKVNDEFGHGVGDKVIGEVADAIARVVGTGGFAARYGGEEFVIVLPGMEKEQAFLLVERIRDTIQREATGRAAVPGAEQRVTVTVSGGVAAFPADGRTRSELTRKADQALYRAKGTGRNRVCIAQEERMATKTSHYTITQLERLSALAREEGLGEAVLLREALDDLLNKYKVSDVET